MKKLAPALCLLCIVLNGCADIRYRSAHGVEWMEYQKAYDRDLIRQGFSPMNTL